jgi:hypothetical protein
MTIQVRCPNQECGKLLAVRDDFAGKTGKCPRCGTTMPIPNPGEAEPSVITPVVVEAAPPEEEEEAVPVRRLRKRRREEEDEIEEEDDEQEDEEPRPRRRRGAEERRPPSRAATITMLSIGAVLLILLALTPLFSMYSLKVPVIGGLGGPTPSSIQGFIQLTQGKVFLIITAVVALVGIAGIVV